jgi:ribosome recycling factor
MEEGIVKDLLDDGNARMDRSVEATKHEFGSVRTGRASPSLLDRVQVDYYGAITPLKGLANIAASEARLLTITPYDKSSIKAIEKAILESDVGLTPSNDGNLIRLVIPELTEERRKDLAKVVRRIAEEGRVGVRNVRHDVQRDLRELKSEGDLGADDEHRAEAELQKLTDQHTAAIDAALAAKEKEILEV